MSDRSIQQDWKYPNLPPRPFVFKPTASHLDSEDPASSLSQSPFRGFYNLGVIIGVIFVVTQPIINFMEHGYFLESTLFNSLRVDLVFCLVSWPLFLLWSFTSYLLQVLIMRGLNPKIATVLQHSTQSGLFIYSTLVIWQQDWCSTHTTFVVIQACAHFMKMHSYITVNRDLREDYEESKKTGTPAHSNYPNNVTLSDFFLFMLTPWLVYAFYPRRKHINGLYLLKKGAKVLLLFVLIYLIHSEWIQPWVQKTIQVTAIELVLRLTLPSTVFVVLCFYLVFENMNNFFAELSRLDYREFYEDWWNSYTYEEFNRKWNKPVHMFLYRHVYLQLIVRHRKGKQMAQLCTFLFSAFLHEFLLAAIFRIVRPIFLGFIIFQVPLINLMKQFKASRGGLYLTWFGLMFGPPLILWSYLYIHEDVTLKFSKPVPLIV